MTFFSYKMADDVQGGFEISLVTQWETLNPFDVTGRFIVYLANGRTVTLDEPAITALIKCINEVAGTMS